MFVSFHRSPTEFVTPITDLATRAGSYAMASAVADGMDFFDVHAKAGEAIDRARAGDGPTLLECKTYRFMGHFVGDNVKYRRKEETEDWQRNRDPITTFETKGIEMGLLNPGALRRIDTEVQAEIDAAVVAAQEAPFPEPDDVLTDVYVDG